MKYRKILALALAFPVTAFAESAETTDITL